MGIAARSNYDLTQHSISSGKTLDYMDPITNQKYIPHVIEPSIGIDRLFLAILTSAYREELVDGETRVVLGFHPSIAPVKVAILPLVSNKAIIIDKSKEIYDIIKRKYNCEFDTSGAVGRRYRRADESGIPYCITIDFETLDDNSVTVRNRDSMEQIRMKIDELIPFLSKNIDSD